MPSLISEQKPGVPVNAAAVRAGRGLDGLREATGQLATKQIQSPHKYLNLRVRKAVRAR